MASKRDYTCTCWHSINVISRRAKLCYWGHISYPNTDRHKSTFSKPYVDKVDPTLASVITVTGGTQSWTVTAAGTDLTFAYNSVNVMRIDSSGNFTVIGNVNTVGTIS
jgi:hypothetical protein